jgi:hypothetical protein
MRKRLALSMKMEAPTGSPCFESCNGLHDTYQVQNCVRVPVRSRAGGRRLQAFCTCTREAVEDHASSKGFEVARIAPLESITLQPYSREIIMERHYTCGASRTHRSLLYTPSHKHARVGAWQLRPAAAHHEQPAQQSSPFSSPAALTSSSEPTPADTRSSTLHPVPAPRLHTHRARCAPLARPRAAGHTDSKDV